MGSYFLQYLPLTRYSWGFERLFQCFFLFSQADEVSEIFFFHFAAIMLISSLAPRGNSFTPIISRAGKFSEK